MALLSTLWLQRRPLDWSFLVRIFEEREVLEVVKDCWDVIKSDIMGVFFDFHAHNKFVKSLNASFIVLIPKTLD